MRLHPLSVQDESKSSEDLGGQWIIRIKQKVNGTEGLWKIRIKQKVNGTEG